MKNRLVGILVLLLIAVIAWPILFDEDIEEPVDITPHIIENSATKVDAFEIEKPQRDLFAEKDISNAQQALENASEPVELDKEKKAPSYAKVHELAVPKNDAPRGGLDKQGIAISWALQLASFVEEARAQELVKQLQAKKHRAYVSSVDTSKGRRYRVYAGPSLDKQALEKTQQSIDKEFKLKSLMVRFAPMQ